jgi:glyoxylase-like metal-dependent hydrolase (beta-lactamase superfamily II)
MQLYTINTGYFKLDGGAMFGVVPKVIWNKLYPADSNNLIDMAMRCLLIEDENRLILIDNGIGDKQDAKFFSHYDLHGDDSLDKSLAKNGFHRDDITDVILTHLHFDHCGGAIVRDGEKLVPAFKNATYWSNEAHWQWAVEPNAREKASFLKENILPIQESGQLKFIENKPVGSINQSAKFSDHIDILFAEGHTASMMLPKIRYKEKTIVFTADLIPMVGHIPLPYVMAYDMFPMTTLNEKKFFLEEAVNNNWVLFFEHDPVIECGTLQQTEKGVRIKELLNVTEL